MDDNPVISKLWRKTHHYIIWTNVKVNNTPRFSEFVNLTIFRRLFQLQKQEVFCLESLFRRGNFFSRSNTSFYFLLFFPPKGIPLFYINKSTLRLKTCRFFWSPTIFLSDEIDLSDAYIWSFTRRFDNNNILNSHREIQLYFLIIFLGSNVKNKTNDELFRQSFFLKNVIYWWNADKVEGCWQTKYVLNHCVKRFYLILDPV